MKILHFGDLHFGMENYGRLDPKTGLHSRFGDFLMSFGFVIDYAINHKVDLVIFAGDAFKTRDPSPTYLRAFGEGIRRIAAAGIPVILVVGNHDLPNAPGKATTLDIFHALAVPNVIVSRQPEYLTVKTLKGTLQIVTLPWMYKSQLLTRQEVVGLTGEAINDLFHEKIADLFREQLRKVTDKLPAIAIVHATVEGATFGSERAVLLGSDIVLPKSLLTSPKLSYVALAHIHLHQQINTDPPLVYCGSLERIDFAEEKEPKGFVVVEVGKGKTTVDFVGVPVRKFLTIEVDIAEDDSDPTTTVVQEVKGRLVSKAVVRVLIKCPESKAPEIRETPIREALERAHFIAGIVKVVSRGQRQSEMKGYSDELLSASPLEALEEFWKKKDFSPRRIAKLKEATQELLESVEQ